MNAAAIIMLAGRRGAGKSTKLKALLEPCRRLLLADPERKWIPGDGELVVESAGALFTTLRDVDALDPRQGFRIIYRDKKDVMQTAAPAAALAVRNLTFAVDELAWLANARFVPAHLLEIVQFGRDRYINLLGTTREPQEVHDMFWSQADLRYFYHIDPGNGLLRIRQFYGKELAEAVAGLSFEGHESRTYGEEGITAVLGREGLDTAPPAPHSSGARKRRRKRD